MQIKVATLETSLKESQEKVVVLTKEKEALEKKQSSAGAGTEGSSKVILPYPVIRSWICCCVTSKLL